MKLIRKFVQNFKRWRWDEQKRRYLRKWAVGRCGQHKPELNQKRRVSEHLVFVCEEFFHDDLRGFGGFGKTVKNIAEGYNVSDNEILKAALAYPQATKLVKAPEIRTYHNTSVVLRPYEEGMSINILNQYSDLLFGLNPRAFISIDWYPSYEVPCFASSTTPLIIWIHDPRDREEWEKIGSIDDELRFRGVDSNGDLLVLADEKAKSIRALTSLQRTLQRKIVFCTTAKSLVSRAERTYGMSSIRAHWLPNPIEIPELDIIEYSFHPTLLYLGRMDAVKRPWIAFELAKRNPDVDILIAGLAHNSELMAPWIDKYKHLSNLKFLGHVDGCEKDRLLRTCWGLLNTSVHEAEPVSFLEAFSYGRCVISCHDPDNQVSRFGYYTGEILGEGLDESSLKRFEEQIRKLLDDADGRHTKGVAAREEMCKFHTIDYFKLTLENIFTVEKI